MKAANCDLLAAPTLVPINVPFLNNSKVGMPRMPNLAGASWFSSTLTLTIETLPA